MAHEANNSLSANSQYIPVIHCNGGEADAAFARYSALITAARKCPALFADPRFMELRDEAWSQFAVAFEVA